MVSSLEFIEAKCNSLATNRLEPLQCGNFDLIPAKRRSDVRKKEDILLLIRPYHSDTNYPLSGQYLPQCGRYGPLHGRNFTISNLNFASSRFPRWGQYFLWSEGAITRSRFKEGTFQVAEGKVRQIQKSLNKFELSRFLASAAWLASCSRKIKCAKVTWNVVP